jgi:hypothetical protein
MMFQRMPPPVWSKKQPTIKEGILANNPQLPSGLFDVSRVEVFPQPLEQFLDSTRRGRAAPESL